MIRDDLRRIFSRELRGLRGQIEFYADDASPWILPSGTSNSTGTLCLHLCGNLQHFVGAILGGTGYVRDREAEFSRRDLSRAELVAEIDATLSAVETGLAALDDDSLAADYPLQLGEATLTTRTFLLHLLAHLGYHLGQIDIHRRTVCEDSAPVPMLGFEGLVAELPGS